MLHPDWSFHSQFGGISMYDYMKVRKFYEEHYPETDPDLFGQVVSHIIHEGEYQLEYWRILSENGTFFVPSCHRAHANESFT